MEGLRSVPEQFNKDDVESNFLENTNNHLKMESEKKISENIFLCVKDGHISKVESLLNSNVDPNFQTEYGDTPLIVASTWGQKEVVRLLLEHGADLNLQDEQGHTALMTASWAGNVDTSELLLKRGANPDIVDDKGRTALDWANIGRHLWVS